MFETLAGLRVVASPAALDSAPWDARTVVLRLASDEAFAIGASHIDLADDHAIVEPETGFAGVWLTPTELSDDVVPHIEWPLPEDRPALLQGSICGVPAKLYLESDRALLLCATAYAHELADQLG